MGVHLCMKSRVGVLHSPVRRIAQAGVFPAFFRRISIDPCPPCVPASPMAPLPQRAPPGGCLPRCRVGGRGGGGLLWGGLGWGWWAGAAATRRRHAALWAAAPALLAAGLAAAAMFAVCGLRAWGYMEQA